MENAECGKHGVGSGAHHWFYYAGKPLKEPSYGVWKTLGVEITGSGGEHGVGSGAHHLSGGKRGV